MRARSINRITAELRELHGCAEAPFDAISIGNFSRERTDRDECVKRCPRRRPSNLTVKFGRFHAELSHFA